MPFTSPITIIYNPGQEEGQGTRGTLDAEKLFDFFKDELESLKEQIEGLSAEQRNSMKQHFDKELCPGEELGDFIFGDELPTGEEFAQKVMGMDNETKQEFAKGL